MKKYMEITVARADAGSVKAARHAHVSFIMELKARTANEQAFHTAMKYYWEAVSELLEARCHEGSWREHALDRYRAARARYLMWSELV